MIRPRAFGPNPETAASNAFQTATYCAATDRARAGAEFEDLAEALNRAGVGTLVFEDTPAPAKPDAVFPNNWVSFHDDGTVVLYPMAAANRRAERRLDIIHDLSVRHGLQIRRVVDLSPLEREGLYLEGTGSLVLDHPHRVAYAALSVRTCRGALEEFSHRMQFECVPFTTSDLQGRPIYHTNVLMSIGVGFAVVCVEAIAAAHERQEVLRRLRASGRRVIEITLAQLTAFAANILELSGDGPVIAMSAAARRAFTPEQLDTLAEAAPLLVVPLATIEAAGGGSVRCMLAEIFLPDA
jgi:hypothetical protein